VKRSVVVAKISIQFNSNQFESMLNLYIKTKEQQNEQIDDTSMKSDKS